MSRKVVIDYFAAGSIGMAFNIPGTWPLNSSNPADIEAADRSWQWNVSTLHLTYVLVDYNKSDVVLYHSEPIKETLYSPSD